MDEQLLAQVVTLAVQAGNEILRVYHAAEGIQIDTKADDSPLTQADLAAHHVLFPALAALLPGVPVLSEESELPPWSERSAWTRYWIIDPLDGTKEFIKRNGEFTVNVALIDHGKPVLGVVHVPVLGVTYSALDNHGAWKEALGAREKIHTRKLPPRIAAGDTIEVVASRSHGADAVNALLERIEQHAGSVTTRNMGSSLKLCLVAEGNADIYPRLALTSEWDTAAAQAIVEAAGGQVYDLQWRVLRYNTKDNILNPFFYVIGDTDFDWSTVIGDSA